MHANALSIINIIDVWANNHSPLRIFITFGNNILMKYLKWIIAVVLILIVTFVVGAGLKPAPTKVGKSSINRSKLLKNAKTFMYQIQDLERKGAIEALAKTEYQLLILEPTRTIKGSQDFNTKGMIKRLRKTPDGKRRLVLAYVDIGEAEDYRTYWNKDWVAPKKEKPGYPDYILTVDPDGWSGNYPVAYWDKRWKDIWIGKKGLIQSLSKDGFDGIYLDWVEAYDDENVVKKARTDKVNPAIEMVKFIRELKKSGRVVHKDFQVVSQNAPYLLNEVPGYYKVIDAVSMEDTWFRGEADASWNSPNGGDIPNRSNDEWSTSNLIRQYSKYLKRGIPVFTVDYCLKKKNADKVYKESRKRGFRPLVTRVELSRLTTTPP